MAISHVDTQNGTGGNIAVVTKPTGTADGDLMIATVVSVSSSISAPAGWTSIRNTNRNATVWFRTFYKVASGEGATFTFTGATSTQAIVSAFTGFGVTPTTDVESGASNASSTAVCAPGITTTVDNDLLFFCGSALGGGTYTPPSGMTEPTNGETSGLEVAYLLDAGVAGATGDKTATTTVAGGNSAHLVAFKTGAVTPSSVLYDQIIWVGI